jgi:sensor histidine kinase YesM
MFKRCLQAAAFNTLIAVGTFAFSNQSWLSNLLFSQCVGLSIWAFIDFTQAWVIKDMRQNWRPLLWIVPVGVTLGYLLGTTVAGSLMYNLPFSALSEQPRKALGFLFISLIAGGSITYFFLSREQLASARQALVQTQLHAEAAQRQAAEAQLKLLQAQLEPHMLFNTLANLRALIDLDPSRAQAMLDSLVDYLRATLSSSRATSHSLQTEFDRLRDYLELMALRMGPRLRYQLELPSELAGLPVPSLILQPLVENAIRHGLEPQIAGGSITVRALESNGQLRLEVQDSGVGLAAQCSPGFGLTQVRERLLNCYGELVSLRLEAATPTGTLACVTLPSDSNTSATTATTSA